MATAKIEVAIAVYSILPLGADILFSKILFTFGPLMNL